MAKHERYAEYKDSGIPWLGRVPAHWDLKRADAVLEESRRSVPPERFKDKEVIHYSIPNIQSYGDGQLEPGEDIASAKILVDRELLLVSKLNPRKATVLIAKPRESLTLCSGEFIPLKASDCDLKFAEYVYLSEASRQRLDSLVRSVTRSHQRATPEDVVKMPWAWPPLEEQQAIAAWLDERTARIDTLIAKKQRLIELLQEKRQAIISKAVTRGLDPHVKLKDSGIPWLGEVPEHWEVKRLKYLSPSITVGIVVTPAKYYVNEGVPCLRTLNISGNRLDLSDLVYISEDSNDLLAKSQIRTGDVLVARTGKTGSTVVVPPELDGANCIDLLIIRRSQLILSEYLHFYITSSFAETQIANLSVGTIQAHFNTSTLSELVVPLPSSEEQAQILNDLMHRTHLIDDMISKANAVLNCLHEYRSSLISAAVTGQIKVC